MASIRDGLGGEELSPSGAGIQPSGAVLLHPYFPGSITSLDQISGTDVYATTSMISDSVYGDVVVSGALLKGGNVGADTGSVSDIVNSEGELQATAVGSSYGAIIQAGSVNIGTNAGSLNVAFKATYAGAPSVIVGIGSTAADVITGAVGAGSAWAFANLISTTGCEVLCGMGSGAQGLTGGPVLHWIAVGI